MNNRQGFTLIEMLVVVAIIGLLSSVVVVGLSGARQKARDAKRLADIQQIMNSAEIQFSTGGYPSFASGKVKLPAAPQSGEVYYYEGNATSAAALACMETSENGAVATLPAGCNLISPTPSCTGGRPNYFCKTSGQ